MLPFEYTMKLIMFNLVGPVHPSHILMHPYVSHFFLYMFTQASMSLYSISKYLLLISYGDGGSMFIPTYVIKGKLISGCKFAIII